MRVKCRECGAEDVVLVVPVDNCPLCNDPANYDVLDTLEMPVAAAPATGTVVP